MQNQNVIDIVKDHALSRIMAAKFKLDTAQQAMQNLEFNTVRECFNDIRGILELEGFEHQIYTAVRLVCTANNGMEPDQKDAGKY